MSQESRAAKVLSGVLSNLPNKFASDLKVLDSWIEDDLTVCLVYTSMLTHGVTGLRRRVETDIPIEAVVNDIVVCDLGEPLGDDEDDATRDTAGVLWWSGIKPEYRHFATKAREAQKPDRS